MGEIKKSPHISTKKLKEMRRLGLGRDGTVILKWNIK
jgi:hypothetical protein